MLRVTLINQSPLKSPSELGETSVTAKSTVAPGLTRAVERVAVPTHRLLRAGTMKMPLDQVQLPTFRMRQILVKLVLGENNWPFGMVT